MCSFGITLNTPKEIGDFVNKASTIEDDVIVYPYNDSSYIINGKSLMGLLALGSALKDGLIVELEKYEYLSVFGRLSY
jgi:hypothetical protein